MAGLIDKLRARFTEGAKSADKKMGAEKATASVRTLIDAAVLPGKEEPEVFGAKEEAEFRKTLLATEALFSLILPSVDRVTLGKNTYQRNPFKEPNSNLPWTLDDVNAHFSVKFGKYWTKME